MQTEQHRTSPPGQALAPEAHAAPEASVSGLDWQPSKGLFNQMLAYRDWWNMPSHRAPRRTQRSSAGSGQSGQV